MEDLREALAGQILDGSMKLILDRIKDKTATAQELSVALKFVDKIGIKQVVKKDTPLGKVNDALAGLPEFPNAH